MKTSFFLLLSLLLGGLPASSLAFTSSHVVKKAQQRSENKQQAVKVAKAASLSLPSRLVVVSSKNPATTRPLVKLGWGAWRRRLDTKQDHFNIHKWAGFGWWLSSTAIFSIGTFSGFSEVPDCLEPITYVFVVSTVAQSLSSIPMALQYRSNEPVAKRGFISSAITSSAAAFVGYWLSPFAHEVFGPVNAASFIAAIVITDAIYSMTSFEDMRKVVDKIKEADLAAKRKCSTLKVVDKIKEADLAARAAAMEKYSSLIAMAPVGLPMNIILLQQMVGHLDNVREYFIDAIVHRGSSPELVYYASIVTSIAVCIGNLAQTLRHRKLISDDLNNVAGIGAIVVTVAFNIRAAGAFEFM